MIISVFMIRIRRITDLVNNEGEIVPKDLCRASNLPQINVGKMQESQRMKSSEQFVRVLKQVCQRRTE